MDGREDIIPTSLEYHKTMKNLMASETKWLVLLNRFHVCNVICVFIFTFDWKDSILCFGVIIFFPFVISLEKRHAQTLKYS